MNQHDDDLDLDPEGAPSLATWLEHLRAADAAPPPDRPEPVAFAALDMQDQHRVIRQRLAAGQSVARIAAEFSLREWVVQNVAQQLSPGSAMTVRDTP